MISAENLQTESNLIEDIQFENDLTERVEQVERGRFMSFVGRVASRVAVVGAVAGSVLIGQGHEETEPAPVLVASASCMEGGVQGMEIGNLCVTKEEPRQPGKCSKTDKFIGDATVGLVIGFMPIGAAVSTGLGLGASAIADYRGGFCD